MKEKVKLALYIFVHVLGLLFKPKIFIRNMNRSLTIISKSGIDGFFKYFLTSYLPKIYLFRTKFIIGSASGSIYKKITPLLPKDFFKKPSVQYKNLGSPLKILVIRFGAMGDVLATTPIIKKMFMDRDGFVEIYVGTRHPEVFRNNPYIAGVYSPDELRNLKNNFGLILDLDLAYKGNKGAHLIDVFSYYAFGSSDCQQDFDKQIAIYSTSKDIEKVQKYIQRLNQPFMICHNRYHPSQKFRGVNPDVWNQLLLKIVENHNIYILQIGGKATDSCLSGHPNLIDARSQFTLQETKELITQSLLYLGIDAGPLHIAAATNVPIVSFFTQSHASTRMPLRQHPDAVFVPIEADVSCYGCIRDYPVPYGFECVRGDSLCSESFSYETVYEKCKPFLPLGFFI